MRLNFLVYGLWLLTRLGFPMDELGRLTDGIEFTHVRRLDENGRGRSYGISDINY